MERTMFSRNIFTDIKGILFNSDNDYLGIYGEHRETIEQFLSKPNQESATALFKFIKMIHQKGDVFSLMNDLRLYENGFIEILPDHREHYLHSASVYVLGLAIYNSSEQIRQSLTIDRHENGVDAQRTSFLFRWSLAACLHDIAYPLEIALKSFNKYSVNLHELESGNRDSFIKINHDIYDRLDLLPILEPYKNIQLRRRDTALGLIADNLTRERPNWSSPITYETLLNLLKRYMKTNLNIGRIDHGVFSALILLKRIHNLYQNNKWNIRDFYYEVVDSATAIFLHNSYRFSDMIQIFGGGKYKFDHPSSLGFLLYLCDTLCEWLRGRERDIKYYGFAAQNDERLIFKIPPRIKDKIQPGIDLIDNRISIDILTKWPK